MRIYIVFCFISLRSDLRRQEGKKERRKEAWAVINDPEKKASGVQLRREEHFRNLPTSLQFTPDLRTTWEKRIIGSGGFVLGQLGPL